LKKAWGLRWNSAQEERISSISGEPIHFSLHLFTRKCSLSSFSSTAPTEGAEDEGLPRPASDKPLTASSGQDRGAHDGDPGLCDLRETVHLFRSMKCDRCNTSLDFIPRLGQFHNSLPLQSYTQNPPPIPLYKGEDTDPLIYPSFIKRGLEFGHLAATCRRSTSDFEPYGHLSNRKVTFRCESLYARALINPRSSSERSFFATSGVGKTVQFDWCRKFVGQPTKAYCMKLQQKPGGVEWTGAISPVRALLQGGISHPMVDLNLPAIKVILDENPGGTL